MYRFKPERCLIYLEWWLGANLSRQNTGIVSVCSLVHCNVQQNPVGIVSVRAHSSVHVHGCPISFVAHKSV